MEINKKQLKKISHAFHSVCNRLLHSDYDDFEINLLKFVEFINTTELICKFIISKGESEQNIGKEVKDVNSSYGRRTFTVGMSDEDEIRDVYAILNYIAINRMPIQSGYGWGYAHSNKYQDWVKGFSERFVMILIRHIDEYLTELGIDMGIDESAVYNISFNNGQCILAESGAVVNATNTINQIDEEKLAELIEKVQKECSNLQIEELANINDNLNRVKEELLKPKPDKTIIQKALNTLNGLKYSAEFSAAVVTLIQFVQSLQIMN